MPRVGKILFFDVVCEPKLATFYRVSDAVSIYFLWLAVGSRLSVVNCQDLEIPATESANLTFGSKCVKIPMQLTP